MDFIEVATPEFVTEITKQAEKIIATSCGECDYEHTTRGEIMWHASLHPNRMGAMYLVGYNDYNEFFELSIYSETLWELREYEGHANAWVKIYPEYEE